jgi:methyl-accepting chemotaxis protein
LIGVLATASFTAALPWIHFKIRASHYEATEEKIRKLVQAAWSAVDYYGKQARAGKLTTEQAQEAAKLAVGNLRYGSLDNEYFWINDLQPRMIMNPSFPNLVGKDLSDFKDPKGVHLFLEMTKVCREKGEGSVAILWTKKGATHADPKINYVKLYEPWGWIIGTGVYVDQVEAELRTLAWVFFGVAGAAGALSLLMTFGVVRSISRPIQNIARELVQFVEQVSAAAAQVSTGSQSLARDASAQAASLEQTSASNQEISLMARRNAENSRGCSEHMSDTARKVVDANQRLEEMTSSMNAIKAGSDKISKIIKAIDEIAFQTNILALNAAVEAARAGEAGMGFAIVAEEVRNLAQRSAKAAQDTASLIEDSVLRTKDGASKLELVAQAISDITGSTKAVSELVDEVQSGSKEQARGIEQIAQVLTGLEQLTQRAAANAEQSAAASEELSAQAEAMKASVRHLDILIVGGE